MSMQTIAMVFGALAAMTAFALDRQIQAQDPATIGNIRDTLEKRIGIFVGIDEKNDRQQIVIESVREDSPAEKSGIRPGDTLLLADRNAVDSLEILDRFLRDKEPGEQIRLTLARGNQIGTVTIRLAEESQLDQADDEVLLLGMTLAEAGQNLAVVSKVTPASPAWEAGIREGDVITAFGDLTTQKFESLSKGESLSKSVRELLSDNDHARLPVKYIRNENEHVATVVLPPKPEVVELQDDRRLAGMDQFVLPVSRGGVVYFHGLDQAGSAVRALVGRGAFADQLSGTLADVRVTGLPAGRYVVAVHSHGDWNEIVPTRRQAVTSQEATAQGLPEARPLLVLGTLAVDSEGSGRMTQQIDTILTEALVGRIAILHPINARDVDSYPTGAILNDQQYSSPAAAGMIGLAGSETPVQEATP